jgi:hypothetical protein
MRTTAEETPRFRLRAPLQESGANRNAITGLSNRQVTEQIERITRKSVPDQGRAKNRHEKT